MKNQKKPVIAVIDSGIKDDVFPENLFSGFSVDCIDGQYQRTPGFSDQIGHGTAIVDELLKDGPEFEQIICIQICKDTMETDPEALLFALEEVARSIICDIVLISSGITFLESYRKMEELIRDIAAKGVTIISALDNDGAISFPAAFSEVVGVGTVQSDEESPCAIPEGPVNLILPNRFYRLKWVSPPKVLIQGSSFGAAHVAALWAKALVEIPAASKIELFRQVSEALQLNQIEPQKSYGFSWQEGQTFVKKIHRAIVFPWNKEIHSLARFQEILPFEIQGFYDLKYNFCLGKSIAELLNVEDSLGVIKNYEDIDWSGDFDTVICGHCTVLSRLSHRNLVREIGEKCKKYRKQLYAFDEEFADIVPGSFIPKIRLQDRCRVPGGRLYNRLTPVVGIVGTSSAQGKFTVQMELRKRFLSHGYSVGQIVSEPSGYLFGCDGVFPFGYHGSVAVSGAEALAILNRMVWEASDYSGKEVVLVGAQSGVVPYSHHNLAQYNFSNYDFLCGVNPDVFVLCVNAHDPIDYIQRSLQYLYSFNGMPVVALILFPVTYESASQLGYGYKKRLLTADERVSVCFRLSKELKLPVIPLEPEGMNELFDRLIESLSE